MKNIYNKKIAKSLKLEALSLLSSVNINDTFTVKIKKPDDDSWIAQYRSLSQFMNGGRGPIFWLSKELFKNHNEYILSILHEYGHVVAEFAWITKNKKLVKLISKYYPGSFGSRPWDEEEFAEEFAQSLFGNPVTNKLAINKICKEYSKVYTTGFNEPLIEFYNV
jgi:hypothetical protein